jgi:hypothetical protein
VARCSAANSEVSRFIQALLKELAYYGAGNAVCLKHL